MLIEHIEENQIFNAKIDDKIVGELTYSIDRNSNIRINHTFVKRDMRTQGIAEKLTDSACKYAESKNFKVIPVCPYVISLFKKSSKYDKFKEV